MNESIPFTELGILPKLIQDYLTENQKTQDFYELFPTKANILKQAEKKSNFQHRETLANELRKQHSTVELTQKQEFHLSKLEDSETYTITTGHQLNLFTGPFYSIIKILQTIKLCDDLNTESNGKHFVPIFWMASEDHDFDEINHFWFNERKVVWNKDESGAVGRFSTEGLNEVLDCFFSQNPENDNKSKLEILFKESYLKHKTLGKAHFHLVNEIFKEFGLIILDADSKALKSKMIPYFEQELTQNSSFNAISKTNQKFEELDYKIQVNPREINLFYLTENYRERITFEDNQYKVLNTSKTFSEQEILNELNEFPERFSPNVVLRPLYQEIILPNLAYIGGNGEISYWLQLKSSFESFNVAFPILIPRNSFLIKSEKNRSKQEKLNISNQDLFKPTHELIRTKVEENSVLNIDFQQYENLLENMFNELKIKSKETDITFGNMVDAQHKKQINGLQKMQKRMLKAETKVNERLVERIQNLHQTYFPNGNLQERNQNFSVFFMRYGTDFVQRIYKNLNPLETRFNFLTIDSKK